MALAEMGYWQRVGADRSVRLLMVLHAKRMGCEKAMLLTVLFHHSHCFWSNRLSNLGAAEQDVVPRGHIKTSNTTFHTWSPNTADSLFGVGARLTSLLQTL